MEGETLEALKQRLADAEGRCERLEHRVGILEHERRELRERLEGLLGLLEGLERP